MCSFQLSYYKQVLMDPNPAATTEVRATTVMLQVAKRLFDKNLMTKYTWSGKSIGGDTKIAFKNFENIIKLFHAIILQYVPNVTLEQAGDWLYKKVIKHVKQRANTTNARQTVGRKSSAKKKSQDAAKVDDKNSEEEEKEDGDEVENDAENDGDDETCDASENGGDGGDDALGDDGLDDSVSSDDNGGRNSNDDDYDYGSGSDTDAPSRKRRRYHSDDEEALPLISRKKAKKAKKNKKVSFSDTS